MKVGSEVWTLELGTDIRTTFRVQWAPKWIRISNENSKYIFFAITFILSPYRTRVYVRKWILDQGLIEPRTNWTAAGDKSVRSIGQQTPDRLQTDVSAVTGRWPKSITLRRSRPRHRPTDTTDAHMLYRLPLSCKSGDRITSPRQTHQTLPSLHLHTSRLELSSLGPSVRAALPFDVPRFRRVSTSSWSLSLTPFCSIF